MPMIKLGRNGLRSIILGFMDPKPSLNQTEPTQFITETKTVPDILMLVA